MQTEIDTQLIKDSQQGSREAFARLLELIYDTIYHFALKWAGCVADAEDITQQVCIKLARVIHQFKFASAFTTWLYRLVINCAHDWSRSQRRHQHSELTDVSSKSLGGDEVLDDLDSAGGVSSVEASTELQQVLTLAAELGEGYREALLLVYAEGHTHREAADVLRVKESTISWRIHEVRKHLKNAMAERSTS